MNTVPEKKESPKYDHSGVPVEALESLRLRLTQLTHSLNKLQTEIKTPNNLPHWVSLQSQFNIILTQLSSLSATLANYSDLLDRTVAYPLPQFPTTEQEGLLTTLLRKKALPEVVDWIQESKEKSNDILLRDDEELTKWALELTVDLKDKYKFFNEDTDSAIKSDTENKPVSKYNVNDILKFMHQGTLQ